ncbi:hypothetical protein HJC23_010075 [Cyclotella cryptica]|uniref:Prolyl 4-hydroxylase alpha subunit Fe(2+) 2OG dioxygenase domain-containing protein n=1 Tax=Cyclotella cryptica TaxID=29204 RepID=A0ABD3Q3U7_9STRA|eukprot:CCRYP_009053-RA/>CCRYP_009053-RA protein AED:0.05 eAED:0.04 QI:0/-1/0/1/-1/1/1/0/269
MVSPVADHYFEQDSKSSVPKCTKCAILASPVDVHSQIVKNVVRAKLAKRRHLVLTRAISPEYLDALMPPIVTSLFQPQVVTYNGGIANVKNWKISCYLEVMDGGVPCCNPHEAGRLHCLDLLNTCNDLFAIWYRQQQGGNKFKTSRYKADENGNPVVSRLMTFITRYTPAPDENALLKHIDGAGKVDGSVVVALPVDRWTASEDENSFEGHGGGLTFWDGVKQSGVPDEITYDTRSGDVAFIDKGVWHQANPITKGTRWALVIFYKVER